MACREAQEQAPDRERQLFDCTLLSLQGLSAEFGADSPEYQAAGQLLVTAVANAQAALAKAYSDRWEHSQLPTCRRRRAVLRRLHASKYNAFNSFPAHLLAYVYEHELMYI